MVSCGEDADSFLISFSFSLPFRSSRACLVFYISCMAPSSSPPTPRPLPLPPKVQVVLHPALVLFDQSWLEEQS